MFFFMSMNLRTSFTQVFISVTELPLGEKLHDLAALLNFDVSKVSGKSLGEESIRCHQKLLHEHWGLDDMAVLPGDDVQCLLLGVSSLFLNELRPFICTIVNLVYSM